MTLKSLLFGSAAIIAAGTGAQAADLPIAEPVEYVRICDAFGEGFFYIPGSDTCLQIAGQVRVEAHYRDDADGTDDEDDEDDGFLFGADDPELNNFTTRARGNMRLDARTQTDFGLIRTYIDFEMQVDGAGTDSSVSPNYSGTEASLASAFIQISNDMGTFTAGHTGSFYDFFASFTFGTALDVDDNTGENTLFAYTFSGGNGFSATLSIEDPASGGRRKNSVNDRVEGDVALLGNEDYEGQEAPDLVANVRIDQGWGAAQIMGVVGQIHDNDGTSEDGDDEDGIGWAVGAGLSTEIPVLGGIEFGVQGGYTEGRLGYITNDPGGFGDFSGPDEADLDEGDENVTEAWHVRAGARVGLTERFDASVSGSYTHVEEGDGDDDDDIGDDDEDGAEYDFIGVVGNVRFKPVAGLYMGPEVAYNHIEFGEDGEEGFGGDDDRHDDAWAAMFRIQRNF